MSNSFCDANEIKTFFQTTFIPIDNIPEGFAQRDKICMEARASLLIEANCTGERFPAFMKCGRYTPGGWVYRFPSPFKRSSKVDECVLNWNFDEFILRNNRIRITDSGDIVARWQLGIPDVIFKHSFSPSPQEQNDTRVEYNKHLDQESQRKNCDLRDLEVAFEQVQQQFDWEFRSRFQLCSQISPYKTTQGICRFFSNAGNAFGQLKSLGMYPDYFHPVQDSADEILPSLIRKSNSSLSDAEQTQALNALNAYPQISEEHRPGFRLLDQLDSNWQQIPYLTWLWQKNSWRQSEEQVIQINLQRLISCGIMKQVLPQFYRKYYENWFCQVFPFKDQYGDIRMQLCKLYDPETQSKILVPVTTWMRSNFPYNQLFCVPLPEDKQPLYNLDLLLKPETETVILTDSVELADSNQRKALDGVVFTSFICSPGRYEQVDWSPLREKMIYYLITNHSNVRPEPAILKAQELRDYFNKNESDIELKFIFIEVEYSPKKNDERSNSIENERLRNFKSVGDILTQYRENIPIVIQDSVSVLESQGEFDDLCQKAETSINSTSKKFWLSSDVGQEQVRIIKENSNFSNAIDYVMHPILIRGELTMIYAKEKTGKSALAYSIAARVAAGTIWESTDKMLLPESWWVVPQENHKVLYLDFENKGKMTDNQKLFQKAYLSKCDAKKGYPDLQMEDVSDSGIDWTLPEHHQKLLDMIEKAQKQGTPGVAVDLLVIDTYSVFVSKETPQTPSNFRDLMNKLRNLNIAVLIVHHANSEGEAKGLKEKCQGLALSLKLSRKNTSEEDLEDPVTVEYGDDRYGIPKKLKHPFQIRYSNNDNLWHAFKPSDSENETLKIFYDTYIDRKYGRDNACNMLGLGRSAINSRFNAKK